MSHLLRARQPDTATDVLEPVMSVTETTDLVQDVLTDCSVVASLCATTSRAERGLGKVRQTYKAQIWTKLIEAARFAGDVSMRE